MNTRALVVVCGIDQAAPKQKQLNAFGVATSGHLAQLAG